MLLLSFLSFAALTVAQSGGVGANYRLFGFIGCTTDQQNTVLDALEEKHTITVSKSVYDIDWNQKGPVDYWG